MENIEVQVCLYAFDLLYLNGKVISLSSHQVSVFFSVPLVVLETVTYLDSQFFVSFCISLSVIFERSVSGEKEGSVRSNP